MPDTIIDTLYNENKALTEYLAETQQISFQTQADEKFRKVLILAAASYFEQEVVATIEGAASSAAPNAPHIVEFVKKKGLSRQYHTLFDWKASNANRFFSFFGSDMKQRVIERVKEDEEFKSAIAAFMELGSLRNELIHLNFADYTLEKTAAEIYELYGKAHNFVLELPNLLAPNNS